MTFGFFLSTVTHRSFSSSLSSIKDPEIFKDASSSLFPKQAAGFYHLSYSYSYLQTNDITEQHPFSSDFEIGSSSAQHIKIAVSLA